MLRRMPAFCPHWVVTAVCEVPSGATPSYAHGYYERDNVFYRAWDRISRDREKFNAWIKQHILNTNNFDGIPGTAG